jgi:hypothetical protein
VARARQAGEVQAVMASLVMMIAGAVNVLAAPWVRTLFSEPRSRTGSGKRRSQRTGMAIGRSGAASPPRIFSGPR